MQTDDDMSLVSAKNMSTSILGDYDMVIDGDYNLAIDGTYNTQITGNTNFITEGTYTLAQLVQLYLIQRQL